MGRLFLINDLLFSSKCRNTFCWLRCGCIYTFSVEMKWFCKIILLTHQKYRQSIYIKVSQVKALLNLVNYLSLEYFRLVVELQKFPSWSFLSGISWLVSLGWDAQLPERIFVSTGGCDTVCAVTHFHLDCHGLVRFSNFSPCSNSELSVCARPKCCTPVHVMASS